MLWHKSEFIPYKFGAKVRFFIQIREVSAEPVSVKAKFHLILAQKKKKYLV